MGPEVSKRAVFSRVIDSVHCKKNRRFYGKITGKQLPGHLLYNFGGPKAFMGMLSWERVEGVRHVYVVAAYIATMP